MACQHTGVCTVNMALSVVFTGNHPYYHRQLQCSISAKGPSFKELTASIIYQQGGHARTW